jgi:hypothetical protein
MSNFIVFYDVFGWQALSSSLGHPTIQSLNIMHPLLVSNNGQRFIPPNVYLPLIYFCYLFNLHGLWHTIYRLQSKMRAHIAENVPSVALVHRQFEFGHHLMHYVQAR